MDRSWAKQGPVLTFVSGPWAVHALGCHLSFRFRDKLNEGMRFKSKLLLSLAALSIAGLSVFLWVSYSVLSKERVDQAFESTSTMAARDRDRLESTMQFLLGQVQLISRQFIHAKREFLPAGPEIFQNSVFSTFEIWSSGEGRFSLLSRLTKKQNSEPDPSVPSWINTLKGEKISWYSDPVNGEIRGSLPVEGGARIVFEVPLRWLQGIEEDGSRTTSLLYLTDSRRIMISGRAEILDFPAQQQVLLELSEGEAQHDRVSRIVLQKKQVVFAALAVSNQYGMGIVSIVPENELLQGWKLLLKRFGYLGGLTLSVAVLLGLLLSRQLSNSIYELTWATSELAKGHFDVPLRTDEKDEVGVLKRSFVGMSKELLRLMKETESKARMEGELKTAQAVQETLFPPTTQKFGDLEVSGFYRSASECGGDFWTVWSAPPFTFVIVADITGHGASAALMTSAARAVVSILEEQDLLTVEQIAARINTAFLATSKGQKMMTAMILKINNDTGEITCLNASHVPFIRLPGLIPVKLTWKNVEFFSEPANPRLGQGPVDEWKSFQMRMNPGDSIVLLTDGLEDLQNPEKNPWGERKVTTQIIKSWKESGITGPHEAPLVGIFAGADDYSKGTEAPDDMTAVLISWKREVREWEIEESPPQEAGSP